jgi:co-chaperonin GroES (HSP10)
MEIKPKGNLLLIKKHKSTALKTNISITGDDTDKALITGEVLSGDYTIGTTVIFGKYAVLKLILQGVDYYFLDKEDVVGECDYKED